jgi:hypothetical protein
MANYATAALLTAQARLSQKYNEAELRRKVRPVIQMALNNSGYSIPDANALKVAEQRPVEVHYKLKKAPGVSTVKAARHTGGRGDSSKVTLSWNRWTETFNFSRKLLLNKVIGSQEAFNHELEQAILNLQDRAETAAVAYLMANRCQLAAANVVTNGTGTWNDTEYALEIGANEKDYFAQLAKTFMFGRNYRGAYDVIADLRQYPQFERVMNQGAGNATNTGFQFSNLSIAPTQEDLNANYTKGQVLIMPGGMFSGMNWNDPLNRAVTGRPDDYVGLLTTLRDPYGLNAVYDISVYSDRADTSGVDGHVQDIVDEYEVSLCIGWVLPPLSTANDSIVHLIANANA